MYTIEELFTMACSLVDSLKTDGTVDASTTSDYRSRTLTLVDISLKKLNIVCDYHKLYEITRDPDTDTDTKPLVKIVLPIDMKSIVKVIFDSDTLYQIEPQYQIERNGNIQNLYVDRLFKGKIRIEYKSINTKPTLFTDIVPIDDVLAVAISYDLATNFVATEQNEYLTNLFKQEFNQLKSEAMKKQPQGTNTITDYYS